MFDNLVSLDNISYVLVFLEGLLSFLSPCVIPLIPVYMSYLAGNARHIDDDGKISYNRSAVFLHTVFFVLGISFTFFLLGMAFTALGSFFKTNQLIFTRAGGIFIIVLGLYQTGLLNIKFLQKERKIRFSPGEKMNPLIAFLMGFTFSFAWTPCVGPALSSVLILASGAKSSLIGYLLVLVYTAGFIIPFLFLGLFTTQVLNFLKAKQKILKYTVNAGGVLLIIIGIMTFTGRMNGISKYLNKLSQPLGISQNEQNTAGVEVEDNAKNNDNIGYNAGTNVVSENSASGKDKAKDYAYNNNAVKDKNDTAKDSGYNNDSDINKDETVKDRAEENINDTDKDDNHDENTDEVIPAIDFTLTDQYGNRHTLSDYKGKVVFLNFWTTWCTYCIEEMPDIEKIYNEYGKNQKDVIILGVASPSSDEYPNNADVSKEEINAFLEEKGITFPVVFDETGQVLLDYYIYAYPTTFIIDKDGNIYGYAASMLTKDIMDNVIKQALSTTE